MKINFKFLTFKDKLYTGEIFIMVYLATLDPNKTYTRLIPSLAG